MNGFYAVSFSAVTTALGRTTSAVAYSNLALQVAVVHGVEIKQLQRAHAGGSQVLQHRAAQPAAAHHQHAGRFQLLLADCAHFGQPQVAAVAGGFGRRQRDVGGVHRARAVRVTSQSFHTGS